MANKTEEIDPVAIVKNYDLRNMSAKVGVLAGTLNTFRVFRLKEPDWAGDDLKLLMRLQPVDRPGAIIERAYSGYERFLKTCGTMSCKMQPVGWDYNIGI
jgi:hypothetical protein